MDEGIEKGDGCGYVAKVGILTNLLNYSNSLILIEAFHLTAFCNTLK
jgi:hypothetical protein